MKNKSIPHTFFYRVRGHEDTAYVEIIYFYAEQVFEYDVIALNDFISLDVNALNRTGVIKYARGRAKK